MCEFFSVDDTQFAQGYNDALTRDEMTVIQWFELSVLNISLHVEIASCYLLSPGDSTFPCASVAF